MGHYTGGTGSECCKMYCKAFCGTLRVSSTGGEALATGGEKVSTRCHGEGDGGVPG